ncbi:MAG: UMP kinase [Bacteroidales bacterium]|jgi:uridylate kinase|nr:UMP kinase [Bacteroidales bacterium]
MKFNRILLKLSGESLAGDKKQGLDENRLLIYAEQIKAIWEKKIQIGIVIGGGNIFRGALGETKGFDRVKGDQMGMLATTINALALQNALESLKVKTKVFTAFKIESIGERFTKSIVVDSLNENFICILSGGTGNPYFSTDTGAALRAIEIEADAILKGTRVDGVYDVDPEKFPNAIKFEKLTFDQVYDKQLKIMDLTAFTLCRDNNMPIIVFDMDTIGNLEKLITNNNIGTIIEKF